MRHADAFFFTIKNSFFSDRIRSRFIPAVSTNSPVPICGTTSLGNDVFHPNGPMEDDPRLFCVNRII